MDRSSVVRKAGAISLSSGTQDQSPAGAVSLELNCRRTLGNRSSREQGEDTNHRANCWWCTRLELLRFMMDNHLVS